MKSLPTARFGVPVELANLASYLVSDYSSWMTGSIINLDGGEVVYKSGEFNQLSRVSGVLIPGL